MQFENYKYFNYINKYPIIDTVFLSLKQTLYRNNNNINTIQQCLYVTHYFKGNIFLEFVNENYNSSTSITQTLYFKEFVEQYNKYTNKTRTQLYDYDKTLRYMENNRYINTYNDKIILNKRINELSHFINKYKYTPTEKTQTYKSLKIQFETEATHKENNIITRYQTLKLHELNEPFIYNNIIKTNNININYLFDTYLKNQQTDKITILGRFNDIKKYMQYSNLFYCANMTVSQNENIETINPYISWSRQLNVLFVKRGLSSANNINIILQFDNNNNVVKIRDCISQNIILENMFFIGILIIPFKDDVLKQNTLQPKHPTECIILFIFQSKLHRNKIKQIITPFTIYSGECCFVENGLIFPYKTIFYEEISMLYYIHLSLKKKLYYFYDINLKHNILCSYTQLNNQYGNLIELFLIKDNQHHYYFIDINNKLYFKSIYKK